MFNNIKKIERKHYNTINNLRNLAINYEHDSFYAHINNLCEHYISNLYDIQNNFNNKKIRGYKFFDGNMIGFKTMIADLINSIRTKEENLCVDAKEKSDLISTICTAIHQRADCSTERSTWLLFSLYLNLDLFRDKGITWENLYYLLYNANYRYFSLFLSHLKENTHADLTSILGYKSITRIVSEKEDLKNSVKHCYNKFNDIIDDEQKLFQAINDKDTQNHLNNLDLSKEKIPAFLNYYKLLLSKHFNYRESILSELTNFIEKYNEGKDLDGNLSNNLFKNKRERPFANKENNDQQSESELIYKSKKSKKQYVSHVTNNIFINSPIFQQLAARPQQFTNGNNTNSIPMLKQQMPHNSNSINRTTLIEPFSLNQIIGNRPLSSQFITRPLAINSQQSFGQSYHYNISMLPQFNLRTQYIDIRQNLLPKSNISILEQFAARGQQTSQNSPTMPQQSLTPQQFYNIK